MPRSRLRHNGRAMDCGCFSSNRAAQRIQGSYKGDRASWHKFLPHSGVERSRRAGAPYRRRRLTTTNASLCDIRKLLREGQGDFVHKRRLGGWRDLAMLLGICMIARHFLLLSRRLARRPLFPDRPLPPDFPFLRSRIHVYRSARLEIFTRLKVFRLALRTFPQGTGTSVRGCVPSNR